LIIFFHFEKLCGKKLGILYLFALISTKMCMMMQISFQTKTGSAGPLVTSVSSQRVSFGKLFKYG
jgi:hypothetical protein